MGKQVISVDGIYKIKGWQGWKHWLGTADKGLYVQQQESAAVKQAFINAENIIYRSKLICL